MGLFTGIRDYLRGYDLVPPEQKARGLLPSGLRMWNDYGVAFTQHPSGLLVHGPGATEAIAAANASGDGNSAVYACLMALSMAYIEAPWRVYRREGGQREEVTSGGALELAKLLKRPNPNMSAAEVWAYCQWSKHIDGNYYLRKIRTGNKTTGPVIQLWPISPCRIELRSDKPGGYISAYRYHWRPGDYDDIPPENMIHGRLMLDDRDMRRGLSPMKRLVRALCTDAAAEAWAERLLANGAVPGLLIRSKLRLSQEDASQLKQWAASLYSGDRLGEPGVIDQDADMEQFGFSPEQMAFDAVRRQPETRISAVLRVPAIVAGLAAGLERSTYANYQEARDAFTETTLLPLWRLDEETIQAQLVPDFTDDAAVEAAHDLSDVRALAEDEDALYVRLNTAVQGGWVTINEARSDVGLDALPDGDVRRIPINMQEVPVGSGLAQMQPPSEEPASPDETPDDAADAADEPTPIDAPRAASRQAPLTLRDLAEAGYIRDGVLQVALNRTVGAPKQALLTDTDVQAWRQRARALADEAPLLVELLEAAPRPNGVAH